MPHDSGERLLCVGAILGVCRKSVGERFDRRPGGTRSGLHGFDVKNLATWHAFMSSKSTDAAVFNPDTRAIVERCFHDELAMPW